MRQVAPPVTLRAVQEIVGRAGELETIERWLDAPHPSTLLIEGEAGIGKTTLWRAGVDEAWTRGWRILSCTAAAAETQLAFTTREWIERRRHVLRASFVHQRLM